MKLIPLTAALSVSVLSGCASIISGSTQSVSLLPMRGEIVDSNTTCTASNKKGEWVASGGNQVTVKKTSEDLQVKCVSNEDKSVGVASGAKTTQVGWAVANFFIWDFCTISCLIDFGSGSIYEYPSQVRVNMPERPVLTLETEVETETAL